MVALLAAVRKTFLAHALVRHFLFVGPDLFAYDTAVAASGRSRAFILSLPSGRGTESEAGGPSAVRHGRTVILLSSCREERARRIFRQIDAGDRRPYRDTQTCHRCVLRNMTYKTEH